MEKHNIFIHKCKDNINPFESEEMELLRPLFNVQIQQILLFKQNRQTCNLANVMIEKLGEMLKHLKYPK